MSFWGKVKHTANKAKKGAEKAGKKAGDAIKDTAENAAKEVERLAKEAEKLAMSAVGDIKNLLKKIEDTASKAKNEIKNEVKKAENFAKKAEHEVKGIPGKVEDAVCEKLPDALQKFVEDIASEAIKPALKAAAKLAKSAHRDLTRVREKHPDLIAEVDKLGFTVDLKVNAQIKLTYDHFYDRAEEVAGVLDRYGNEGLKPRRRDIIAFIKATGATTIDFGGGAAVSLGVDAGAKFLLNKVSNNLFVELADTILEELGVPE